MREKTTAFVLLGVLAAGGPMTGYDLRGWIAGAIGHFWSESFGQIYPELKRMTAEGLVSAAVGADGRKPYRITAAGRAALSAWLERQPQPETVRSELLLKLYFGRFLGTQTARDLLTGARDRASDRVAGLETAATALHRGGTKGEELLFSLLVTGRGLAAARAEREWATLALKAVDALEDGGPDAALATLR
jgi:PadR family transcriptional regulator AphA